MVHKQKSMIISGAASGIGRATALEFASRGWFIGAIDSDADALERLSLELPHEDSLLHITINFFL